MRREHKEETQRGCNLRRLTSPSTPLTLLANTLLVHSFSVYLVHPLILTYIITSRRTRTDMSSPATVFLIDFPGLCALCIAAGTIICVEGESRARKVISNMVEILTVGGRKGDQGDKGGRVDWELWRRVGGFKKVVSEIEFKAEEEEGEGERWMGWGPVKRIIASVCQS